MVVPVVVVAAGVGLATWWLLRRKRNRRRQSHQGLKPRDPVLAGVIVDGQGPRDQGLPGASEQYMQVWVLVVGVDGGWGGVGGGG